MRCAGTFAQRMNLRSFPFDEQHLTIRVVSRWQAKQVKLDFNPGTELPVKFSRKNFHLDEVHTAFVLCVRV
eukprot:m.194176 g.194176  ORF g.194176 m.194176 type:complete len:71 (+) comp25791_c0_seq3:322-534(+)